MSFSIPLERARETATQLREDLLRAGATEAHIVGAIRREEDEIEDINLVVISNRGLDVVALRARLVIVIGGADKVFARFAPPMPIDVCALSVRLWRAESVHLGAALFKYTGPTGYVIGYCSIAKRLGMKLNETGLWAGDHRVAGETEESIYSALGKTFKPPADRGRTDTLTDFARRAVRAKRTP